MHGVADGRTHNSIKPSADHILRAVRSVVRFATMHVHGLLLSGNACTCPYSLPMQLRHTDISTD